METQTQADTPRDIDSTISDEDIERATAQIGIPQRRFVKAFNETATTDGMRHFAFGLVGDDNPLWHDPDYAKNTRWRGPVAHPLFIQTMGINECQSYSTSEEPRAGKESVSTCRSRW